MAHSANQQTSMPVLAWRDARVAAYADRVLQSVVDYGLAGIVLVAPWFMGGRHPLGELVLVCLAVSIALSWMIRQTLTSGPILWTRSSEWLLVATIALVAAQLVPLPPAMLQFLSPHMAHILPLWMPDAPSAASMGLWTQVTMTPDATQAGLVMLLAYGLIFLVAVQQIQQIEDVERILLALALMSVAMAGVGILQYVAGNGKFLWVYQHPYRDTYDAVKGPFINKNHFAHFLALGLGPVIWSIQRALNPRGRNAGGGFGDELRGGGQKHLKPLLSGLGLGLVLFAGLLTLSRGGAAVMLLAAAVSVGAFYHAKLVGKRFVACLAGVFLLIGALLAIHGFDKVSHRLGDFTSGSIDQLDQSALRRSIWEANARAAGDFCRLGTGVGSHRDIYPIYFQGKCETEFTHAENGYLQIAMETGVPGFALLLFGIVSAGTWCAAGLRSTSQRGCAAAAAVTASLAASVVHSGFDFVWYISSCMAITVLLLACAFRLAQFSGARRRETARQPLAIPRWIMAPATVGLCLAGGLMAYSRFGAAMAAPHWDAYTAHELSRETVLGDATAEQTAFDHLQQVVRWTPHDARAHIRLAAMALRRFDRAQQRAENQMPLTAYSSVAPQFATRQAFDEWLSRSMGENRKYLDFALWHAHAGLSREPLQAEGYAYLAVLGFLEGLDSEQRMAQALCAGPNNGMVMFLAGQAAILRTEHLTGERKVAAASEGQDCWGRALAVCDPIHEIELIDLWSACRLPVENIVQFFNPDLTAVRLIHARYSQFQTPDELRPLLECYALKAEEAVRPLEGAAAADIWRELQGVYRLLSEPKKSLACAQRALAIDPNDYQTRYGLGICLYELHRYAAAEQQLKWCLQRRPEDEDLKTVLAGAVKGRLQEEKNPVTHANYEAVEGQGRAINR